MIDPASWPHLRDLPKDDPRRPENLQPAPLPPAGVGAALLAVRGVITLDEAAAISGFSERQLTDEAEAWGVVATRRGRARVDATPPVLVKALRDVRPNPKG